MFHHDNICCAAINLCSTDMETMLQSQKPGLQYLIWYNIIQFYIFSFDFGMKYDWACRWCITNSNLILACVCMSAVSRRHCSHKMVEGARRAGRWVSSRGASLFLLSKTVFGTNCSPERLNTESSLLEYITEQEPEDQRLIIVQCGSFLTKAKHVRVISPCLEKDIILLLHISISTAW